MHITNGYILLLGIEICNRVYWKRDGTDVCGCSAWSFLDNFEWGSRTHRPVRPSLCLTTKSGHNNVHPKPIIVFLVWQAVSRRPTREDYSTQAWFEFAWII